MIDLNSLGTEIIAIGALGTAAFGLVDSFKALPGGGISRSGFKFVSKVIEKLTPPVASLEQTELSRKSILYTLQSQWINGVDKSSQVSIAKSLIKLRLIPETATALAAATGVDGTILAQVSAKIQTGGSTTFSPQETDVYGRFDLLLNTLLDQAYQRADQRYRNAAKAAAIPVAVALAVVGAYLVFGAAFKDHVAVAILMGLIATPIAPVAKDIASAISTAAQVFGKK